MSNCQQTMKLKHATNRLKKCRDREANAARAYCARVRESERAEHALRYEQRQVAGAVVGEVVQQIEGGASE